MQNKLSNNFPKSLILISQKPQDGAQNSGHLPTCRKIPNESIQNLVARISAKTNNLLIKKGVLEKVEEMVLVGNTDDIFSESSQNSFEGIHLPAQVASVAHRIAFGPNANSPELVRYMARNHFLLDLVNF